MSEQDKNPSGGEKDPDTDKKDEKNEGDGTFTQEELGQKLSAERKRLREQFEKEKDEAIKNAIAESERKAKLSDEQRAAEAQKAQIEALEKRERDITLRERKAEALETLASKNIPAAFADYVVDEDADKMADNISQLGNVWSEALKEAVKEAAKGTTPSDPGKKGDSKSTVTDNPNVFRGNGVTAF